MDKKEKTIDIVSSVLGIAMFIEWILLLHCYWEIRLIRVMCFATVGFTGIMIALYMFRKAPAGSAGRTKKLMRRRVRRSFLFARRNFMYAFFITLFASLLCGNTTGKNVQTEGQQMTREEQVFYDKLTLHERTLDSERKLLKKAWKKWDQFSVKRKKEVLERVIDIEATNLGLGYSVTLVIKDLDDMIEGRYRDYEVQLHKTYFETDSFLELVEAVSHEMYHSFQEREIDEYEETVLTDGETGDASFFYGRERRRVIENWKEEFAHYQDGGTGETEEIRKYYYQEVEMTARAYSERRVEQYKKICCS